MKILKVFSNGLRVGELDVGSTFRFVYDKWWVDNRNTLPISTTIPVTDIPYSGAVVFNFFDNLLPEDQSVREWLAKTYNVPPTTPALLQEIGRDCVGSLQLIPQDLPDPDVKEPEYDPISDQEIINHIESLQTNGPLSSSNSFRISIAGFQKKTALLYWKNQWNFPNGPTPTTHILKLPMGHWMFGNGSYDFSVSVTNEAFCLQLASLLGINAAKAQILRFGAQTVLSVERFDRFFQTGKIYRIFQEDFCQAFGYPSNMKYGTTEKRITTEMVLELLANSNHKKDGVKFLKAQLFNIIIAGGDAHAKNFSILRGRQGFALAPLYDLVSYHGILNSFPQNKALVKLGVPIENRNLSLFDLGLNDILSCTKNRSLINEEISNWYLSVSGDIKKKVDEAHSLLGTLKPEENNEIELLKSAIVQRVEEMSAGAILKKQ